MRPETINDHKLLRLIDRDKLSQAEAARRLGVSRQAVHQRLQEIRGKATKVVVAKKLEEVVDNRIDAMGQLKKINDYANELLDLLMRWNRGDEEALQVLENQVKRIRVGKNEEVEISEVKFKDPRELSVKVMGEIRRQSELQFKIFESLYSMQAVDEFQAAVLETIAEVDDDARRQIIRKLNEKSALRSALRFS